MTKIEERVKELEKLDKAATPGPWDNRCHNVMDNTATPRFIWAEYGWVASCDGQYYKDNVTNAILIAAYRNETPKLIQALREAVDSLEDISISSEGAVCRNEARSALTRIEALLTEGK